MDPTMDPITMTFKIEKTTKGTTKYQEVTDDDRGHTFYLLKSINPDPPQTIQVYITDAEE